MSEQLSAAIRIVIGSVIGWFFSVLFLGVYIYLIYPSPPALVSGVVIIMVMLTLPGVACGGFLAYCLIGRNFPEEKVQILTVAGGSVIGSVIGIIAIFIGLSI